MNLALTPRSSLWTLRVTVVALAVLLSQAIGAAAEHRNGAVMVVATTGLAIAIAAMIIAVVVPSALGLTVVRVVVPAAVPASVVALALDGGLSAAIALGVALLATAIALGAETGEAMVQGSAYGDERRLPLKVPAAMLLPIAISWLLWCAVALTAVVLLCARQWFTGAVDTVLAALLTWVLFRRFHRFSRRWLVVVPAGVVVHDEVVLGETVMVQTTNVKLARLALADTQAADLTGPAAGHALEISVKEMVTGVFAATPKEPKGRAIHMQAFLVAPSRPGRALQSLAAAKLPVA